MLGRRRGNGLMLFQSFALSSKLVAMELALMVVFRKDIAFKLSLIKSHQPEATGLHWQMVRHSYLLANVPA